MHKHKSLLYQYEWEEYDRKIDIGLSTIYQNNTYEDIKIGKQISNKQSKNIHHGNKTQKSLQFENRIEQFEKNLYTLQNKQLQRGENNLIDHTFINRKLNKKLKRKYNNKTTMENQYIKQRYSNGSKKSIKIGCYQFGEIDKKYQNSILGKTKISQPQSNHLKWSVKQKLQQFINARTNQRQQNDKNKARRFLTINNPEKHYQNYHSLSPIDKSYSNRPQNGLKQSRKDKKSNYWDFTVVSLENIASKRYAKHQFNANNKESNKFPRRNKLFNRQSQQKRKQCLYKSNLFKNQDRISPLESLQKKQLDYGQNIKLKQIIRKYFSSKNKYNSDDKLLKIQQITK